MRKILILIITIVIAIKASAQITDTARFNQDEKTMRRAGYRLMKASDMHTKSMICYAGGTAIILLGAVNKDPSGPLIGIGGAVMVIGFVLDCKAWSNVGKGGIILNGTGITIPLDNKKKEK